MFLPEIATFCVWTVKVLMRLYICAGLSESPLQQPSGPRDVCFCLTLLLSVCEQWRYWWDCTYVQACPNLHCSNLVDLEMYVFAWHCYFLCVNSEGIDETVHMCRLVWISIAATQWVKGCAFYLTLLLSVCEWPVKVLMRLYISAGLSLHCLTIMW